MTAKTLRANPRTKRTNYAHVTDCENGEISEGDDAEPDDGIVEEMEMEEAWVTYQSAKEKCRGKSGNNPKGVAMTTVLPADVYACRHMENASLMSVTDTACARTVAGTQRLQAYFGWPWRETHPGECRFGLQ